MGTKIINCANCGKKVRKEFYIIEEGILKGTKVMSLYCNGKCRKIVENKIKNSSKSGSAKQ